MRHLKPRLTRAQLKELAASPATEEKLETINDLYLAAREFVNGARFVWWLYDMEAREDQSFAKSIEKVARVLESMGVEPQSMSEFVTNLENLLKSGLSLDEYRKSLEWQKQAAAAPLQ